MIWFGRKRVVLEHVISCPRNEVVNQPSRIDRLCLVTYDRRGREVKRDDSIGLTKVRITRVRGERVLQIDDDLLKMIDEIITVRLYPTTNRSARQQFSWFGRTTDEGREWWAV